MPTKLFGLLLNLLLTSSLKAYTQPPVKLAITTFADTTAAVLPFRLQPNNYTQHLPFFCKEEWKLEQKTKLPLKFRLGSVSYVDRLEGKQSASPLTHY